MEISRQTIVSLEDVLLIGRERITDIENNIEEVLPVWISIVGSNVLKGELEHYLYDIRGHLKDMSSCKMNNGLEENGHKSKVVISLIDETNFTLRSCADTRISDAYLIYAIQAINHFKINIYGTLATYADILEQHKTAETYHKAMLDEKVSDMRLSKIAERNVNVFAKLVQ